MQDAIILYENGKAIGGEGHPTNADDITFDNAGTDIVADKVGSAIKEVNAKFDREYVEVSADGTKTRSQLFDALYALIDYSKINIATSVLIISAGDINNGSVYYFDYITSAYYRCSGSFITPTGYGGGGCELKPSGSTFASMSNGTVTNQSSQVLSSAYRIRFYY